jgi:hypothetical protein
LLLILSGREAKLIFFRSGKLKVIGEVKAVGTVILGWLLAFGETGGVGANPLKALGRSLE